MPSLQKVVSKLEGDAEKLRTGLIEALSLPSHELTKDEITRIALEMRLDLNQILQDLKDPSLELELSHPLSHPCKGCSGLLDDVNDCIENCATWSLREEFERQQQ